MAQVGPGIVAAIAATSTSTTALAVAATAAAALSAIAQGNAARQQAQNQQAVADLQARKAMIQAKMDANSSNQSLLETLAHNNAVAAAGGLMSAGTVSNAEAENIRKANEETSILRQNGEMNAANKIAEGEMYANQGNNAALSGYLTAGQSMLNAFQTHVKTKG